MNYEVRFTPKSEQDLAKLLHSEPKSYQKALRLISELREHHAQAQDIPNH